MAFMDIFAPKAPATAAGNAAQGNPQNPNQNQGANGQQGNGQTLHTGNQQFNQNSGANPGAQGNTQNAQNQQTAHPLDAFNKMWDNPSTDEGTPPAFALDPKVLTDVAGKQDFMQGIDPELVQRATNGDTKSLMEIIHAVSRNAYAKSIEHTSVLTDKFVGARETHAGKHLGSKVRGELTTHELSNTPGFQHPVVKKQLTEIAERLQRQHPDASPQEIAKQAKQYLSDLMAAMQDPNESKGNQQANSGPKETDWDAYWDADNQSA